MASDDQLLTDNPTPASTNTRLRKNPLLKSAVRFLRQAGLLKPPGPQLSRQQVIWAFRSLLDRDPNPGELQGHLRAWKIVPDLRRSLITSTEFKERNPDTAYTNESNVVITEMENGLRLFVDLADLIIGINIIRRRYECSELAYIRQTVKPGQNVLDLGANVGFFAMEMASLVGPSGTVVAFEPLPHLANLVERSIHENHLEAYVTLKQAAAGEARGVAPLVYVKEATQQGGAFLINTKNDSLQLFSGVVNAEVIPLDECELSRPINFIKVDVEGAEPMVFRGAERLLQADRPIILSELHAEQLRRVSNATPSQYVAQMQQMDYECFLLEDGKQGAKWTPADVNDIVNVIFVPMNST